MAKKAKDTLESLTEQISLLDEQLETEKTVLERLRGRKAELDGQALELLKTDDQSGLDQLRQERALLPGDIEDRVNLVNCLMLEKKDLQERLKVLQQNESVDMLVKLGEERAGINREIEKQAGLILNKFDELKAVHEKQGALLRELGLSQLNTKRPGDVVGDYLGYTFRHISRGFPSVLRTQKSLNEIDRLAEIDGNRIKEAIGHGK